MCIAGRLQNSCEAAFLRGPSWADKHHTHSRSTVAKLAAAGLMHSCCSVRCRIAVAELLLPSSCCCAARLLLGCYRAAAGLALLCFFFAARLSFSAARLSFFAARLSCSAARLSLFATAAPATAMQKALGPGTMVSQVFPKVFRSCCRVCCRAASQLLGQPQGSRQAAGRAALRHVYWQSLQSCYKAAAVLLLYRFKAAFRLGTAWLHEGFCRAVASVLQGGSKVVAKPLF